MLDTERGTQNEIETLIKNLSTMKKMNSRVKCKYNLKWISLEKLINDFLEGEKMDESNLIDIKYSS